LWGRDSLNEARREPCGLVQADQIPLRREAAVNLGQGAIQLALRPARVHISLEQRCLHAPQFGSYAREFRAQALHLGNESGAYAVGLAETQLRHTGTGAA